MQNINEITVLQGQNLLDIAVQHTGSTEAVFLLAMENGLGITDELTPGMVLNPVPVQNRRVRNYFANNNLKPATAITADDMIEEGIEFWYVEYDFVVS